MATLARIEAAARRLGFRLVAEHGAVRLRSPNRRAPAALAAAVDHFERDLLAALHEREVAIAERIAIAVHEGGLAKPWAAMLVRLEVEPEPPGWPQDCDWAVACAVFGEKVAENADALRRHAWTPQAIWRGMPDGDCPDLALWIDDDTLIEAVEPDTLWFRTRAGRSFRIPRRF